MLPLQITLHHTTLAPELERQVRARADRLARYYGRISACRVTIDVPQSRRHSDAKRYGVRIALAVPGGAIVISRQPRADLMTELQRAFEAARRRLQDRARHLRGAGKLHEPRLTGRVSELDPLGGYGFLLSADEQTVYFDRNGVTDGGFDRLEVGSRVRYREEAGEKGPQASSVVPLGRRRPRAAVKAD
jgi:cold shock CspA family protein